MRFTAITLFVAALVVFAGALFVPGERFAVAFGAGLAAVVQAAAFWVFSVWLFPGRMWEGYGLGLLVRFAVFAAVAFLAVPAMGLPLAATLFSLAGVFWLSSMVEPLFLKARTSNSTQR